MRPLTLKLNNFGPFLQETIDFDNVRNNQLFLISGKTGSGKTMIFDAMVYALFGEASTNDRQEGDLRSHFADGKSPMSVEFEFKLKEAKFKIVRQGAFVKEGNKNKTLGQLAVYQLEDDVYSLRESKIIQGNNFIKELLGVNAEQFRQLFILPQGEFKRFLLSRSKEKQSILRTLFNSERFEQIQKRLIDEVSEVRTLIEKRYNSLENNWQDINAFEDDLLNQYKLISSRQTNRVLEALPEFTDKGQSIQQGLIEDKAKQESAVRTIKDNLELNLKLEKDLAMLDQKQQELENLKQRQQDISEKTQLLNDLNEVKPLVNLIESQEKQHSKKEQLFKNIDDKSMLIAKIQDRLDKQQDDLSNCKKGQPEIDSKRKFLEKCSLFYEKKDKYQQAYTQLTETTVALERKIEQHQLKQEEVATLIEQLNHRKPNYAKVDTISTSIFELNMKIKELKNNEIHKLEYDRLVAKKESYAQQLMGKQSEIKELEQALQQIDKTNLDLNNKQELIATIQAAVQSGDTCPVCGKEVDSLEQHIDFDELTNRHQRLADIEQEKSQQIELRIKLESDLNAIEEQLSKYDKAVLEDTDYKSLEQELFAKQQDKVALVEENKQIEQLQEQLSKAQERLYHLELEQKSIKHQVETHEIAINDFEVTTQYNNVEDFVTIYKENLDSVNAHDVRVKDLESSIQQDKTNLTLETNNKSYMQQSVNELNDEINTLDNKINEEMAKLGFSTFNKVQEKISKIPEKEQLEVEIEQYNKAKQTLELAIAEFSSLTRDKELQDIDRLREQYENEQQKFDLVASELSKHEYKMEFNAQKINEIEKIINQLEEELKEQQEIFQLSEILSGQNNLKLTLENYVLIHYLERILAQANQRLSLMTGQRYRLSRRQQVSKGYSGLEIEVFDTYSNQTRHITSLSGGETFQASLALALGLSEVVQEESGGITLESMFVDEGFGTLDQETLETALDTLMSLKSTGRMVGIISHVSELKQRIPLILEVQSDNYQSITKFKQQ